MFLLCFQFCKNFASNELFNSFNSRKYIFKCNSIINGQIIGYGAEKIWIRKKKVVFLIVRLIYLNFKILFNCQRFLIHKEKVIN